MMQTLNTQHITCHHNAFRFLTGGEIVSNVPYQILQIQSHNSTEEILLHFKKLLFYSLW